MHSPLPTPNGTLDSLNQLQNLAKDLHGGQEQALGPWYELEYPKVHRLCMGFLGSRSEADDVAQDAMLHLASKLTTWDPQRPYGPWRNTLVSNLCRDRLRAQERRKHHEDLAAESREEWAPETSGAELAGLELQAILERTLAWLAPREREAFVLIDLEGHSAAEAAEQLGLAASTLRANLALARRKLRGWLADLRPGADL